MHFLVVFERLFYNVSKFLFLFQRFLYKLIYYRILLRNLNNWQFFFWKRVLTFESSCFSFSFLSSNSFSSLLSNLSSFFLFLFLSFYHLRFWCQNRNDIFTFSTSLLPAASIISTSNSYGPAAMLLLFQILFPNPYHACCSLIKTKALYFLSF